MAGVEIWGTGSQTPSSRCVTDEDGRFRLEGMLDDTLRLYLRHAETRKRLLISPDKYEVKGQSDIVIAVEKSDQ